MLSEFTTENIKSGITVPYSGNTSNIRQIEAVYTIEGFENSILYIKESFESSSIIYQSILKNIKLDLSSIYPNVEPNNETFICKSASKETMDDEDFEYDVVFRMPPKRTYKVLLDIKSIEKAVPKFVLPEE